MKVFSRSIVLDPKGEPHEDIERRRRSHPPADELHRPRGFQHAAGDGADVIGARGVIGSGLRANVL
jgi:hypothetical protein